MSVRTLPPNILDNRTRAPEQSGLRSWVDVQPRNAAVALLNIEETVSSDGSDIIWRVGHEAHAYALTGACPPGLLAAIVPHNDRNELARFVQRYYSAFATSNETAWNMLTPTTASNGEDSLNQEITLLRPGDVLPFRVPPRQGIFGAFLTPFTYLNERGAGYAGLPIGVHPAPVVRCYLEQLSSYSQVPYTKAPAYCGMDHSTTEPSGGSYGVYCAHARYVTIQILDENVTHTVIQGAETADFEIWWRMPSGMWAHNPADDFDAAGRGAATRAHDVEVYEIPGNAVAVYARRTSGNDLTASFTLTE